MRLLGTCLAVAVVAAMAAACAPRVDNQGNALDAVIVDKIKPGQHNRAHVARLLGTPSSTGTFDQNTWYYISKRTENIAFFTPETVEQNVVVVKFDDSGVVSEVKRFNGESARNVQLVTRETPSRGRELGLMGQLYKTLLSGPGGILGDPGARNEGFVR